MFSPARSTNILFPSIGALLSKQLSWKDPSDGNNRATSRKSGLFGSVIWHVPRWWHQHQLCMPQGSAGPEHEQPPDCESRCLFSKLIWSWSHNNHDCPPSSALHDLNVCLMPAGEGNLSGCVCQSCGSRGNYLLPAALERKSKTLQTPGGNRSHL